MGSLAPISKKKDCHDFAPIGCAHRAALPFARFVLSIRFGCGAAAMKAALPTAVVLLSGGLDSATVLAMARERGLATCALSRSCPP
jgi:hypothetical protein